MTSIFISDNVEQFLVTLSNQELEIAKANSLNSDSYHVGILKFLQDSLHSAYTHEAVCLQKIIQRMILSDFKSDLIHTLAIQTDDEQLFRIIRQTLDIIDIETYESCPQIHTYLIETTCF